ncbi:uncharacterized protein DDB_G0284459-like [Chironomus tepperi]|uniref:uncharacterized protein DDB_G0284459-like n=1 Tax=Chironomus tepperi TaxID=113505 RepID=UPI00391EF5D0
MSRKVCIICLVSEVTTRLFCMQAAQNEDGRRYELLTGIKLKCPAFICQRCSIDLSVAAILKNKALESAKFLIPSLNQNNVPAIKNSPVTKSSTQSQVPTNKPSTPSTSQMTTSITQAPLSQTLTQSSKTALPLGSNMSRTDKIMSSTSIISSTVINPPMDMSKISDLFKTNPSISIIKTKRNDDGNKDAKDASKEEFPIDHDEKKSPVNYNTRITKRRQTICAEKFYNMQKQAESQAGRKLGSFQPTILAVPKKIVKAEVDKKADKKSSGTRQEKASQKRQAEEIIDKSRKKQKIDDENFPKQAKGKNQSQNKYNMRHNAVKSPVPEYQYWIKSKADGYYIETFKCLERATSYLEKLPKDATYGPLSDD